MTKAVKKVVKKGDPDKPKRPPARPISQHPQKSVAIKMSARSAKAEKPKAAPKKQVAKPKSKVAAATKATAKKTVAVKKAVRTKAVEPKAKKAIKKTAKQTPAAKSVKAKKPGPAKGAGKTTAARKTASKKPAAKKTALKTSATKKTAAVGTTAKAKKAPVKPAKRPAKASIKKLGKPETEELIKEFRKVVNLTPDELERRLSTPIAKKLGMRDAAKAGIVGHESGKRILAILNKSRRAYTEDDLRHMKIVVKYVRKRRAEKPPGDVFASNWRFSLLNWGHDPMRSRRR